MANVAYNLSNPVSLLPPQTSGTMAAWFNALYLRITNGIKFSVNNVISGTPTNESINNNSLTMLTWGNIVTDTVGGFSTTNNNYVIQTAGTYLFHVQALLNSAITTTQLFKLHIYQNGALAAIAINSSTANAATMLQLNVCLECVAKDTIDIRVIHTAGSAKNIDGNSYNTFFQGHRIN